MAEEGCGAMFEAAMEAGRENDGKARQLRAKIN
jgi:hypothetical protein